MDYEDIIKLPLRAKISRFKEKSLKSELIKRTNFLPESSGIGERIYCLDNNINEVVYCYCGNPVKYLKYSEGYSKRCSKKCVYLDPSVSEKRKNTCLDKYGVDSFTKTQSYLEKTKQTNLEKYGEDFYLQTEIKKEKTKQTNLEKYGAEHHMKSSIFMEKFKENNIKIFGVDNVSKLDDVKIKKKSTFQKNYGIDHIFSSNVLKGLYFKEKYGYDPYLPNELKSEFKKYKDEVWKITNRYKKELIFNWSGYDYYDNLYIKENYKLNYNDNSYPSIDHKISIYDGFINKIDPFVIGDINNLCITKRSINRNKGILSEDAFKDLLL
jgi:hypothetical protein